MGQRVKGLAIALAAGALPIAAFASVPQDGRGAIDQIQPPRAAPADRVSSRAADIAPPGPKSPAGAAPQQLTSEQESAAPARQLTNESRSAPQAPQLYRGGRTAQPSQPLSNPRDGRTGAVEAVTGKDRCDPAADGKPPRRTCADVIENRAAEFARREPQPLSPEQRIIAEQQLRDRAQTISGAAKRLAVTGEDADSIEAQGVASVVLRRPPEEPRDKPKDEPAASDQLQAIVNAIVGSPPPN